jgi:lantibiotic modifying enzyme
VQPLGLDLSDGLPGVALFLAHLGSLLGERQWASLARAALATMRRRLAEEKAMAPPSIGAFDGLGGCLYVLAHLKALWREHELTHAAEALVEAIALTQRDLDVAREPVLANGLAGALAGLLAFYRVSPTVRTLQVACQTGEQLLHALQTRADPVDPSTTAPPFTAFVAGRAGVVWTLLALAEISGQQQFATSAEVLLAGAALSRAHGRPAGPGLLLSYLRAQPWIQDAVWQATLSDRVKAEIPALLELGLGHNHSLAYGDLGHLDLMLQASSAIGEPDLKRNCMGYAAALLGQMQRHGWVTGAPLGVETPGLMAGLAGIGYGLLRLAVPGRTPSVLALALPGIEY